MQVASARTGIKKSTPCQKDPHRSGLLAAHGLRLRAQHARRGDLGICGEGPENTIRFSSAEGLETVKTKIRYKRVDVGTLITIRLSEDHIHIIAKARTTPRTDDFLVEDTQFWVVRVRISGADHRTEYAAIRRLHRNGQRVRPEVQARFPRTRNAASSERKPTGAGFSYSRLRAWDR